MRLHQLHEHIEPAGDAQCLIMKPHRAEYLTRLDVDQIVY
jgi:hypothetical protein